MPRTLTKLEGLSRQEWLEARRQGIGSSDVAAICGLDRYRSPLAVYLDKTGQAEPEEETSRMRFGRKLETVIAEEFCEVTGYTTESPTVIYQHDTLDYLIASPDRNVYEPPPEIPALGLTEPDALLEAKTYTGHGELWDDGPPIGVILQTTEQLIVTARDHGYVGVLKNGHEFHHWRVDLEPRVVEIVLDLTEKFWGHVQRREPPPVDDGHDATTAGLQRLYSAVEPGETVDVREILGDLRALKRARAKMKDAKAEEARLANIVKARLGAAEFGTLDGTPVCSWKASSEFDSERFVADHPDLAAAHSKVLVKDLEAAEPALVKQYRRAGSRRLALMEGIE